MWRTSILIFIFTFLLFLQATSQDDKDVRLANEYYNQGETEKALVLFEELAKDSRNIPLIHNNYFYLLLQEGAYDDATKYIKWINRQFPDNINYALDHGYIHYYQNNVDQADAVFKKVISQQKNNTFQIRLAADYFANKQLYEYAVIAFKEAREEIGADNIYALELANVYRMMNEKDLMVEEYLNFISNNPSNLNYVKNTLQNLLTEPEELESLQTLLYAKIQKDPDNKIYPELLIWSNLQQKNFYGAFIQARALDKKLNLPGMRSFNIGKLALQNQDYKNAERIFQYIIDEYRDSNYYLLSRMYLIRTYEEQVKNSFPVNITEIEKLIRDYQIFIEEAGINRSTLEAMRNKALLHAFYLDQKDSAIFILKQVINNPRSPGEIAAQSKLDLGDIYLLKSEPWESTLLYSQVEKENDDSPIGYEAKLKNAKLSYYRGDFLLAQDHLNILKEATTREIANDAMALSLLIKDNIAFDSSASAMKAYAQIELLLFQNKYEEAQTKLDSLSLNLGFHNLNDEILWLQADLSKKEGLFEIATEKLESIYLNHPDDILADDAFFERANILDRHLQKKDQAMELYKQFLIDYPGSVYVSEARKRFRELRGDFEPEAPLN